MASSNYLFGDNQWTNDSSLPSAGLGLDFGLSPFGDSGLDGLFPDTWNTAEDTLVSAPATVPQPIPVPNGPSSGPTAPPTTEEEPKAKCKPRKAKWVNAGAPQFPTPTRDSFVEIKNTLPTALPTSRVQTALDGEPSATDIENAQANPSASAPPVPVPMPLWGSAPVIPSARPTQNIKANVQAHARKRKNKNAKAKDVSLLMGPPNLPDTPTTTRPTLPSSEPQPRSAEDLEIRATTAPGTVTVPQAQPQAIQIVSQGTIACTKISVSKKRKLDEIDEAGTAEPSGVVARKGRPWWCDFCEFRFIMVHVKEHYRRKPCKQNKLKYEFIHGAVPSWWRKERGHHGSHVRPQEFQDPPRDPKQEKQEGEKCGESCEERRKMWEDYAQKHPEAEIEEIIDALAPYHAPLPAFRQTVIPPSVYMPPPPPAPLPRPPAKKRVTKARRSRSESITGSPVPSPRLLPSPPSLQTLGMQVPKASYTSAMSNSSSRAATSGMDAHGGQPWVYPVNPNSYMFTNAVASSSGAGVRVGQTSNENLYGPSASTGSYTLPPTATGNMPQYTMPMGSQMYYPQKSVAYSMPMDRAHRSLLPDPAARATGSHYYGPYGYNTALPVNYSMLMGQTVRSPSPAPPAMGGPPNRPHDFAATLMMMNHNGTSLNQTDRSLLSNPASPSMGAYYNLHGYVTAALPTNQTMSMNQTNSSLLPNPATPAMGGDYYRAHNYTAAPLEMNHGMPIGQAGDSLLPNPAAPVMGGTDYESHSYAPAELAANEPTIPPADTFDDDYPWFAALLNQHNDGAGGAL